MRWVLLFVLVSGWVIGGCVSTQPPGRVFDWRPSKPGASTSTTSPNSPEQLSPSEELANLEPVWVPTPDLATYRGDLDVRELYRDLWSYVDVPLFYRGMVWAVIEQGELAFVQVKVPFGAGPEDWKAVIFLFPLYRVSIDTQRIREGVTVEVWGRPRTMFRFTEDQGKLVQQPLLLGDQIKVLK